MGTPLRDTTAVLPRWRAPGTSGAALGSWDWIPRTDARLHRGRAGRSLNEWESTRERRPSIERTCYSWKGGRTGPLGARTMNFMYFEKLFLSGNCTTLPAPQNNGNGRMEIFIQHASTNNTTPPQNCEYNPPPPPSRRRQTLRPVAEKKKGTPTSVPSQANPSTITTICATLSVNIRSPK